ncbi:MAG: hypothetical protein DLM55_08820 [Acidimicrobiales bacterium]|nr:MAG: hypothetical protein DLM55_08820 [Acidimicrobiales bacterium]
MPGRGFGGVVASGTSGRGCDGGVQVAQSHLISLQDKGISGSWPVALPLFVLETLGVGGDGLWCWRILADVAREAGVDLEELQHQRESEAGGAALVGDQLALVVLDQRPREDIHSN